jgi:hypothetical protein
MYVRAIIATWWREVELQYMSVRAKDATWYREVEQVCTCYHLHLADKS